GLDINLRLALADGHEPAAQALAHAPCEEGPEAEEHDCRNDPGEQVLKQRTLDLARIGDAGLLQLVGGLRVDSGGHELLLSPRQRLLQGALYVAIRHRDPIDLAVLEQSLKLAVGNGFDPLIDRVEILEKQDTDDGSQPIANMELRLLVHGCPPGSRSCVRQKLCGTYVVRTG